MASFKKVQEMLCLGLVEEIIDEEEFVLLYDTYRPRNLPFPHSAYEKFSLANKDPAECKADFRVEKRDIPLLVDECWQFLVCMTIWKILLSVQSAGKCVYMVTQPTRLESTSKLLSELGF